VFDAATPKLDPSDDTTALHRDVGDRVEAGFRVDDPAGANDQVML
jgi:hypothetical protein